ncbi:MULTISPECIES: DeoR/GlpR family DNA-binding transcription regulator [Streptacidiphilus]|uniref:DeoR/GlpR family DNA-binding transcription regulator n=1 Tax=Streptacidiphilus cavernicola TaxID=3342716 RepID=A0ABV6UUK3_9ACTN|nr:DeoR/GlpR family DNA-binding transcription regulator [Streptacidiphilus jeojiense]
MLPRQRQGAILDELRARGEVDIAELAMRLGVSEATVRRDLGVLARQGHPVPLRRAAAPAPRAAPSGTATHPQAEQEAIAAAAAGQARPDMTIGLSGGTAVHKLAVHLRELPGLTVVTNSLVTATILTRSGRGRARPTVILTGGYRTPDNDLLHGPVSALVLRSMRLELAFLDCAGLDGPHGASTDSLADSDTRRALVQAAAQTCVLATAAQCGRTALSVFAGPEEIDFIVTASAGDPSPEQRSVLRQARGAICVDLGPA